MIPAIALEALASDLFEQRTTLCHPREPEELEAVVAIHEMIKNLDTSHNLGLFATNDPAHFLASPSGLAAVSRLPSYKAAVAARKGAARPPRRQGETSTHKSQKLSFDCPPNPPGDVGEPGALLSTGMRVGLYQGYCEKTDITFDSQTLSRVI